MSVPSPCIRLCVIDTASGLCRGCGRTLDEIASWPVLSEEARRTIVARLATAGPAVPAKRREPADP